MRFEVVFLSLLVAASGCSFLAPSDGDLMGSPEPDESDAGQRSASGGSSSSRGGNPSSGGTASSSGSPSAGDTSRGGNPNAGGEVSTGGAPADPDPEGGNGGQPPDSGGEGGNGAPPSMNGPGSTSGTGLLLWLRADSGLEEQAGTVARWQDASGASNHATQDVAGARPTKFQPDPASLPMVSFDGVDDYLSLPSGFSDFKEGLSFFAVVYEASPANCPSLVQLSAGSEVADIDFGLDNIRSDAACGAAGCRNDRDGGSSGGKSRTVHFEVGDVWLAGPAGTMSATALNVIAVLQQPDGNFEVRINGIGMPGNFPLPVVQNRVSNFIGRTLYGSCAPFRGRIGELLLYARALETEERVSVETYLKDRW